MKQGMLKIHFVLGGVAVLLAVLLGRVYFWQCTDQKEYIERKQSQLRSTVKVEAKRGQICDRRGSILALSTSSPMLWCDPKLVKDRGQEARLISEISEIQESDILKKMAATNLRYSVIAKGLMDTESHKIRALISQDKLPGVYVKYEEKRVYPKRDLFGVQIGFCDSEGHGSFGVEKGAEYYLSGIDGWNTLWRDNRRRRFFTMKNMDMIFDPLDGQNIYLTIDEKLQQIAQDELAKAAEQYTPKKAGIIILDPKTGEILAMASWPFFDPNQRNEYREGVFNNLLLSEPFEPGSIMKPVSGSLALTEGIVNLASPVFCENGLWHINYGRKGRDLHDDHKLGTVTFKEVIKYSSNIGIAKVSEMLGEEKLYKGLKAFGFGNKCDLKILGDESKGSLKPVDKWSALSIHSIPMGQEISVTALQMVSAIGTIANRGTRMRPRLVSRISMADGSISPEARDFNYFEPVVAASGVISEKAALDMTDAMVSVTDDDGTGRLVQIPGYKVAAKTGTAQQYDPEIKGYSKRNYVASLVGFVPAYDPKLVCVVTLDSPRGSIYGGKVAAPVFREVMKAALEYLQVPADFETEEETEKSEASYAVE